MKDVRFTRDMAPHGRGDRRIVPDEIAIQMEKTGDVDDVRPFPDGRASKRPAKTYTTKDGGK